MAYSHGKKILRAVCDGVFDVNARTVKEVEEGVGLRKVSAALTALYHCGGGRGPAQGCRACFTRACSRRFGCSAQASSEPPDTGEGSSPQSE
jgi:hypothetical protein